MTEFHVVPGAVISRMLGDSRATVIDLVRRTYLAHEEGLTINPDSYFLRFPDRPSSRVIALPAYLGGGTDRIGIKWIASFPENTARALPRASAVLLLNDYGTGYPIACLESGGISAARTAASAACAAVALPHADGPLSLSFVGAGVIARTICDYLAEVDLAFATVSVHDLDPVSAGHLVAHAARVLRSPAEPAGSLEAALTADLVVFATTAGRPYVPADVQLRPGQLLLHVSLRDLAPETLLAHNNVLDDVEHCLKASTSPHLAEQLSGGRDFVDGTLGAALRGELALDESRATIFSPFGLGVLDVAVGSYVLDRAKETGETIEIPDFFGELTRW